MSSATSRASIKPTSRIVGTVINIIKVDARPIGTEPVRVQRCATATQQQRGHKLDECILAGEALGVDTHRRCHLGDSTQVRTASLAGKKDIIRWSSSSGSPLILSPTTPIALEIFRAIPSNRWCTDGVKLSATIQNPRRPNLAAY